MNGYHSLSKKAILEINDEILKKALQNTVKLIDDITEVEE